MPKLDPDAVKLTAEQQRRLAEVIVPMPRDVKFDLRPYSAYHGWRRQWMRISGWFARD